jgi:hypothetical protein
MDKKDVTDNAPVALVPAAWTVAVAAWYGVVSERTLLIAHVVMAVLLVAFAAGAWEEMSDSVLRAWRGVLVSGIPVTVAGVVGLSGISSFPETLVAVSLYGWMLLPAVGLVYTGREVGTPEPYVVGGTASAVGAAGHLYAASAFPSVATAALVLVGLGQTVGIADAVYRY